MATTLGEHRTALGVAGHGLGAGAIISIFSATLFSLYCQTRIQFAMSTLSLRA